MTYDILTGYNVWYWGDSLSNRSKESLLANETTWNRTDLGESHFHVYGLGRGALFPNIATLLMKTWVFKPFTFKSNYFCHMLVSGD